MKKQSLFHTRMAAYSGMDIHRYVYRNDIRRLLSCTVHVPVWDCCKVVHTGMLFSKCNTVLPPACTQSPMQLIGKSAKNNSFWGEDGL